jgi:hypothetical protein
VGNRLPISRSTSILPWYGDADATMPQVKSKSSRSLARDQTRKYIIPSLFGMQPARTPEGTVHGLQQLRTACGARSDRRGIEAEAEAEAEAEGMADKSGHTEQMAGHELHVLQTPRGASACL